MWTGRKRAEFRRDDRLYAVGDRLDLREWDPATEQYTGFRLTARVTHLARGPLVRDFGVIRRAADRGARGRCKGLSALWDAGLIIAQAPAPEEGGSGHRPMTACMR